MSVDKGLRGEKIAGDYLIAKGYQIITSNYRSRFGEIDLIMLDQETTVFVEVKFYHRTNFADVHLSLTKTKKLRLKRVINKYLSQQNKEIPARFDVVLITEISDTETTIEHFCGIEI